MTYEEAVDYIESTPKFTKKNGPDNTLELVRRLGHPERNMKVIHVAGTNGKGSVCAFLSNMLTAGGKKTGLFTSPHLVRLNERFQIDHETATDLEFTAAFEEVMGHVHAMIEDGYAHPAYFELLFAMMLVIFRDRKVEYAVLETGLGGRLDATNVVEQPVLTVLTSISLDHTEILGDTITQIAGEKVGIIKEGVPLVFDGRNEEAAQVIEKTAKEKHAPYISLQESMYEIDGKTDKSIDFILKVGYYEHNSIRVPFPAEYQAANSALALLGMEFLDPKHEISLQMRKDAMEHTTWQGRMETVLPGVIVDGAHNADGILQFARTLAQVETGRKVVLLFSAVVEKNYEKMIKTICDTGRLSEIVVTEIHGGRIVPADQLAEVFRKYTQVPVTAVSENAAAFALALEKKEALAADALLFCAGSLYLVGELKEIIEEKYQ